jgi:U4/U6.U5 tri-snRNP-associated protein 2
MAKKTEKVEKKPLPEDFDDDDDAEPERMTDAQKRKLWEMEGYIVDETARGPFKRARRDCPYLGSINRNALDFDFEKMCSATLSSNNVYVDLVDGKFFEGLGKHTQAHRHALEKEHYLWMSLEDGKVYCIPDGYEVLDKSLDDIKFNFMPMYTDEEVREMSTRVQYGKSLDGTDFIPGCIGMNSVKDSSYLNVVVQIICQIIPLRNFLLQYEKPKRGGDPVLTTLADLIRKLFNARNFKGLVSPHEFLQAVAVYSKNKFFTSRSDPAALMSWLLNRLQKYMKKQGSDLIHETMKGELLLKTSQLQEGDTVPVTEQKHEFLMLTCDLPPDPLFKDDLDFIPHVPLATLLDKFNGESTQTTIYGEVKRYTLRKLPPYLILTIKRFEKNNFFWEKNPTIVNFPLKGLDLKEYLHPDTQRMNPETRYDLVANAVHEGKADGGTHKVYVHHAPLKLWHEIQDLRVSPVLPQIVALAESYILVFQRTDVEADGTFQAAEIGEEPEHVPTTEMEMAPEALAEAGIIIG